MSERESECWSGDRNVRLRGGRHDQWPETWDRRQTRTGKSTRGRGGRLVKVRPRARPAPPAAGAVDVARGARERQDSRVAVADEAKEEVDQGDGSVGEEVKPSPKSDGQ